MFTREEFDKFQRDVASIIEDTFLQSFTDEDYQKADFEVFGQYGLWSHMEKDVFLYNKQKIDSHKMELLSICRGIPKMQQPCNEHAGIISSFDLLPHLDIVSTSSPEETVSFFLSSTHFANLLCGADIASVVPIEQGKDRAFLIVLNKEYRSYFEE